MNTPTDILHSFVRLVGRLSGAASVSLFVPAGPGGEHEILVHDGRVEPVPELADADHATEFHRRSGGAAGDCRGDPQRVASGSPDGVLYRVPLRRVLAQVEEPASTERRRRLGRSASDLVIWIGLRFEHRLSEGQDGRFLIFKTAAASLDDEDWWKGFLGLAPAFVSHARTLSSTVFDHVTGLPDRAEFQAALDAALVHANETGLPAALLLLGPDDFGWVNERVNRRAGDQVLREIATGLRAGLRSQDQVARYGGAIFAVVLLDTPIEDARLVAENAVRRLGEQRYHGGILRLEFSAGVAVTDPAEPIDAQELIRRADQALSAAKRGNAGSVRVWERGSDVERADSLDRLQGIFTGEKSQDYRNMRLLLESVAVVAGSTDPAELARSFTERLFETLHARRVGVLERGPEGQLELLGGIERSGSGTRVIHVTEQDLALVQRACQAGSFVAQAGSEAAEPVLCAMPLSLQGRCLGGIVLEVRSLQVSFEGANRRFLDALASEMAVALDRARLIERERQRQQEEKERLEAEVADLRRVVHGSRLAYRSAVMETLLATVRKVARTDTTVLITGESGTGKEMLANVVHELSGRHERPMVVVDCGAIAPTLIESELFGHERGAFTGAHVRRPGRLAQADGATLFLDEVGDLPLDLQGKLLRFVQKKQFTPVGSVVTHTVDVRIIAATNVDLRSRVAEGRFREDLYHRLNVVRLQVPPLRERPDDILHLATIFLKQFAALYRRPAQHFTSGAELALEAYPWPGNVRELQNLVLTSVLFCDAPDLDVGDLQGFQAAASPGPVPSPADRRTLPAVGAGADELAAAGDPQLRLRRALANAVSAALAGGRLAVAPIGKWLTEDLILAADRLSLNVSRRGAELLGLPETTYRRQLQKAMQRRTAGLALRSPWWPAVAGALEPLIHSRPAGTDLCQWTEACLLGEIESAVPGDMRTAAALLGVSEPTLLRRLAQRPRRS